LVSILKDKPLLQSVEVMLNSRQGSPQGHVP
jgi:hypothetical protein